MLKNYSKIKVDENGNKYYYNDEGEQHRLDGPAIEYSNGTKFWYINGIDHRNIDPSDEFYNGEKRWWFNGEYHRIGGSFYLKFEAWNIQGKEYTKKEYFNKVWDI